MPGAKTHMDVEGYTATYDASLKDKGRANGALCDVLRVECFLGNTLVNMTLQTQKCKWST